MKTRVTIMAAILAVGCSDSAAPGATAADSAGHDGGDAGAAEHDALPESFTETALDTQADTTPDSMPDTGVDTSVVAEMQLPPYSISFRLKERKGSVLSIEIVGNEMAGVFGVAALVDFDPSALSFKDASFTDALGNPASEAFALAALVSDGRVTLGIASRHYEDTHDMAGAQPLAVLKFKVLGSGQTGLGFDKARSVVLDGWAQKMPVLWLGAKVTL